MGPDSVGNVQKILPFGAVFCDLASTCTTVTLGKGIQYGNQEKVRQIIRDLRKKLKSIG
jgi:hypothetical protein